MLKIDKLEFKRQKLISPFKKKNNNNNNNKKTTTQSLSRSVSCLIRVVIVIIELPFMFWREVENKIKNINVLPLWNGDGRQKKYDWDG